jgi:flagellar biosynthesis protein FliP
MTGAGYAGIVATLAFVLGLIMLIARVLKRFAPGLGGAGITGGLNVVQRIPLGQRQSIAVVQSGDQLIALSVGDGGVRPLFTLPRGGDVHAALTEQLMPARPVQQTASPDLPATSPRPALTLEKPRPAAQVERGRLPRAESIELTLGAPGGAIVSVTPTEAPRIPAYVPAGVELAALTPRATSADAFQRVLNMAMRSAVLLLAVSIATGVHAVAQTPQQSAPAPQAPTTAPNRPQAATNTGAPALRQLPAPTPEAGPRDRPRRADPTARAPRPAAPATTASKSGGVATTAPLLPPEKARDMAAMRQRAQGAPPLTTPDAQRIASRADSMLSRLAPKVDMQLGGGVAGEGLRLSGTVGIVVMMGLLSLLPMLLLMMTGFTRILVVLHFLKQALGTQTTPPGQLIAGLALILSGFVMAPTLTEVNTTALDPWMKGQIEQVEMMSRAVKPFKSFMLDQVRDQDLQTFLSLTNAPAPATREDTPLLVLMSAFVTSELRTAFQIGFALFLPFIVIDVAVSSVLMSMGMVMLPPAMISLPFKLLLFVLVDGWNLVVTGLVQSFH